MSSSHFITNDPDRNLASVINGIIPGKTESMDFLVGYFYFTGIEQFAENVKDKRLRILIGKDLDPKLVKMSSATQSLFDNSNKSTNQIREGYKQTVIDLINNSAHYEDKQNVAAYRIYMDKLKNGTLEIRLTKEPWHAKLYIFNYYDEQSENGETPGCVITGSSNLTYSGLQGQGEINVRFNSRPEYEEASKLFNRLWDDSTVLVNQKTYETFRKSIVEKTWLDKNPSPYLAFLRVLHEFFNLDTTRKIRTPYETTRQRFQNLKYQDDAIRMALNAIEKHNGVIIADVVGLGKSIIASSVADNLRIPTIIIAPPHLKPQWEDYKFEFHLKDTEVISSGKIESLGLNTWWVGGTYNRKGVQEKSEGAKPVGIIAVGYGQTQGVPHKTKTAEQVSSYNGEAPQWFKDGIEAALLAPTALAKQAFTISGTENRVSISCNNGIFTGVDTGLVKYHFELGAGKDSFEWA